MTYTEHNDNIGKTKEKARGRDRTLQCQLVNKTTNQREWEIRAEMFYYSSLANPCTLIRPKPASKCMRMVQREEKDHATMHYAFDCKNSH